MSYEMDAAVAFNMYCDANRLSLTQGIELAEAVGEALASTADDRRSYLPADLQDEPPNPSGEARE